MGQGHEPRPPLTSIDHAQERAACTMPPVEATSRPIGGLSNWGQGVRSATVGNEFVLPACQAGFHELDSNGLIQIGDAIRRVRDLGSSDHTDYVPAIGWSLCWSKAGPSRRTYRACQLPREYGRGSVWTRAISVAGGTALFKEPQRPDSRTGGGWQTSSPGG